MIQWTAVAFQSINEQIYFSFKYKIKQCIECIVEFKIKGDNPVNDTKIQLKLLDFQCGLSPTSRQIGMINYTFHHIDL